MAWVSARAQPERGEAREGGAWKGHAPGTCDRWSARPPALGHVRGCLRDRDRVGVRAGVRAGAGARAGTRTGAGAATGAGAGVRATAGAGVRVAAEAGTQTGEGTEAGVQAEPVVPRALRASELVLPLGATAGMRHLRRVWRPLSPAPHPPGGGARRGAESERVWGRELGWLSWGGGTGREQGPRGESGFSVASLAEGGG